MADEAILLRCIKGHDVWVSLKMISLSQNSNRFIVKCPDCRSPVPCSVHNVSKLLGYEGETDAIQKTFQKFGRDWKGRSSPLATLSFMERIQESRKGTTELERENAALKRRPLEEEPLSPRLTLLHARIKDLSTSLEQREMQLNELSDNIRVLKESEERLQNQVAEYRILILDLNKKIAILTPIAQQVPMILSRISSAQVLLNDASKGTSLIKNL